MKNINFIILFFIVGTYVKAQDTLTYKGLIMTPISGLSHNMIADITDPCDIARSVFGIESVWFKTDTSLDYMSNINNGVFITGGYTDDLLDSNPRPKKKTIYKEFVLTISHDIFSNRDIYTYKPSTFFRNMGGDCKEIQFYIAEVEFKYILLIDEDTIEIFNLNAQNYQEIEIKYPTTTYFITEIMSIKPYKVTDKK